MEPALLIHVVYVLKESEFPAGEERAHDLCWAHCAFSLLALSYTCTVIRKEVQPLLERPIHVICAKNLHFHARSGFLTPMTFGAIMPYDAADDEAGHEGEAGHNCDETEPDHSIQALDLRLLKESKYLKQVNITIERGPPGMEGPVAEGASRQECDIIYLLPYVSA